MMELTEIDKCSSLLQYAFYNGRHSHTRLSS
jgi:hypothetical protein